MSNIKHKLNIMGNIALTAVICVVLLTAGLYMWEKGRSVDEYVIYYGNVSTERTFSLPNPASFYTFGKWVGEEDRSATNHITFVSTMWCKPTNTDVNPSVIDTRIGEYNNFVFANEAPADIELIKNTDTALRRFLSFGVADRDEIRAAADEQNYTTWNMGAIAPSVDSSCYVTIDVVVYTDIFQIPKTIRVVGNTFDYYVEGYNVP